MKKLFLVLLALAVIGVFAFAQDAPAVAAPVVSIGEWGRSVFAFGNQDNNNGYQAGVGASWGSNPRIGLNINAHTDTAGFSITPSADNGTFSLTDQNKAWINPLPGLTFETGIHLETDTWRGSSDFGSDDWIRYPGVAVGGNSSTFVRLGEGGFMTDLNYNKDGIGAWFAIQNPTTASTLSLTGLTQVSTTGSPIVSTTTTTSTDGKTTTIVVTYKDGSTQTQTVTTNANGTTTTTSSSSSGSVSGTGGAGGGNSIADTDLQNAIQAGAAYTIDGIGTIKAQYLGKNVSGTGMMGNPKTSAIINAAFRLSAVPGLYEEVGFIYPTTDVGYTFAIADDISYTMAALTAHARVQAIQYDSKAASSDMALSGGAGLDYDLGNSITASADFQYVSKQQENAGDSNGPIAALTGVGVFIKKGFSNGFIGIGFQYSNIAFKGSDLTTTNAYSHWAIPIVINEHF